MTTPSSQPLRRAVRLGLATAVVAAHGIGVWHAYGGHPSDNLVRADLELTQQGQR